LRPTAGEYGVTFCTATAVDDATAGSGESAAVADWAEFGESAGEQAAMQKPAIAMAVQIDFTGISYSPLLFVE